MNCKLSTTEIEEIGCYLPFVFGLLFLQIFSVKWGTFSCMLFEYRSFYNGAPTGHSTVKATRSI